MEQNIRERSSRSVPTSAREKKRTPYAEHVTHLTQLSDEVRWAFTHEAVQHRAAVGAVPAWTAVTFIPLDFTVSADEPRRTLAVETVGALLNNKEQ